MISHVDTSTSSSVSPIDPQAAEVAAAALLEALGVPLDTPSTVDTPARMAGAYRELLTPKVFQPTTFPNEHGYQSLLLARSVPFASVCAHHMMPFTGTAHVGYLPGQRLIGLSKLARLVQAIAARPQIQEELTEQVATWLDKELDARGIGVVITAEHLCMTIRGAQARGTTTVTTAWRGDLADSSDSRTHFHTLAEAGR